MKNVSVLIKPASSLCNMNCRYCFYKNESANRSVPSYGLMTENTTENIIIRFLSSSENSCHFAFQGGEPTLAGIEYFRFFVSKVKEHNIRNVKVTYSIQSNGYNIPDELLDLFYKYDFLVGISLDGYKSIHNYNRFTESGKDSFNEVSDTINKLRQRNIKFNILSVITNESSKHPDKIMNYFTQKGFEYIQFIPCLSEIGSEDRTSWLSEQNYSSFLISTFNYISKIPKNIRPHIRFFDNLFSVINGGNPESCNMCGKCTIQFVIEANGNVYPCDFYCTDAYLMGNINKDTPDELLNSPAGLRFIEESLAVPAECSHCRFYPLCRNGCKRERQNGKNIHCSGYKKFFDNIFE